MLARLSCVLCAAGLVAVLLGCRRPAPAVLRVEAKNYGAFYYWRSSVSSQFTPEGWREFNDAILELKFEAMARGATGTEAVNAAMCQQINGRTIGEVLRLADEGKFARLVAERDKLKIVVDANALLAARPGDADLAESLHERRQDQEDRLQHTIAKIETVKQRLIAHGGVVPVTATVDAAPAVLSRDEARSEFARMIHDRRMIAEQRYGDWPARIDRSGADLDDEQRDEFLEKQNAAKTNGHTVIPVYLRVKWRIYDAVVNYPEFSDSVMRNLTAADRDEIETDWADSEAEIWARKQASRESPEAEMAAIKKKMESVLKP